MLLKCCLLEILEIYKFLKPNYQVLNNLRCYLHVLSSLLTGPVWLFITIY